MQENRLKLIKDLGLRPCSSRKRRFGLFLCDCGNTIEMRMDSYGKTRSCGCLKKEQDKKNLTDKYQFKNKWKYNDVRLRGIWDKMIRRCTDERYDNRNYIEKGIKVCDEWLSSFDNFAEWAYENGYKSDLTIDRVDNSGNYEPSNCRWATMKEQANNRDSNIIVEDDGKEYTLMQIAEKYGISYSLINSRYHRGDRTIKELIRPKFTRSK